MGILEHFAVFLLRRYFMVKIPVQLQPSYPLRPVVRDIQNISMFKLSNHLVDSSMGSSYPRGPFMTSNHGHLYYFSEFS